jgi:hypothetical protein
MRLFRRVPPRAQTPETKPPPDRGGKPTHVVPSKVSSMLAVCLLDLCSRHSTCHSASVEHYTTSQLSCQDQRMCFVGFLRPSTELHLRPAHPGLADILQRTTRGACSPPWRTEPVGGATVSGYHTEYLLSNSGPAFFTSTPSLPDRAPEPRRDNSPSAAQRGPNLSQLSRRVKSGVQVIQNAPTWTCGLPTREQVSLRRCIPGHPQRVGPGPGASR